MMNNQELTWNEWLDELAIASGGEIDYWYLSEDNAKIEQPE